MGVRDISVVLSATVAPFKAQMVAAGSAVHQFGGVVEAAAVKNNKAVMAMATGMAAVGAAAVGMAALSVRSAIQMETRMQNVATIWTDTGTSVAQAGSQIVEMSKQLPQSANNLAEGLYQVASSGFQGAAGMQVLEASATAASAGLTDTATAATGITAVLNAYGLKAGEAAHVSDVLFQTVNLGVVSFEQLSETLGDFVGLAATAHISIEDVTSAYATMTLNGISAAESGTSVNRVIQSIIQPSKEMAAVLSAAGYASGQAALDALGLKGVVELLGRATGGSATAMGILVPEIRGLRGMLALTSAEGANYTRVQDDMTDKSELFGETQRALAKQSKSTSFQLGILKNTVVAIAIGFGQALLPVLKPIIGLFQALADTFSGLSPWMQTAVGVVGLLTAVIVGLAGAYLLLAPRIAATITLMEGSAAAATLARGAFTALKFAMGFIGVALAVATPLMMAFAKSKGEAKRQSEELKAALDQETGAIVAGTAAAIAKSAVDQGLDKDALEYGISLETLTSAMLGNADAQATVQARMAVLKGAWNEQLTQGKITDVAWEAHTQKIGAFGKKVTGSAAAVADATTAVQRDTAARGAATGAINNMSGATEASSMAFLANADALRTMAGALAQITSIDSVLSAAASTQSTGQSAVTDAVKAGVNERHQVEKDALDATQKAESDALESRNQGVADALARRHKLELDALALIQRGVEDALELRFRAEMDAYDREARAQNNALDDRHRAEKNAMDDRLALLDVEYDKKKKAEDRAYQTEVDRIQGLIDSTFGEEREGYKRQLLDLEDNHDARLGEIDQAKKVEARTLTDGLDDTQRAEKQGLTDSLDGVKTGITDRQAVEKTASDDAYTAKVDGLTQRQTAETTALGVTLDKLVTALDLQQQAIDRALTKRQTSEDTAADTRRTSTQAKADLTLADIQAQFTDQQKLADQSFVDLEKIYTRGGDKVSIAMLAEIQKLPPKVQTELANAGQPAFDKFIESLRLGMETKDLSSIAKGADRVGVALADGVIAGFKASWGAPGSVSHGILGPLGPLLGGIPFDAKADGAVSRQAMMSSVPILWAEAGPEAYIPLSRSKMDRSLPLLAQAAGAFSYGIHPMGNGGIIGGRSAAGGGGLSVTVYVENHLAPGIDMGVAGRVIRAEAEAAVRAGLGDLDRQIVAKAWRN